MRPCTRAVCSDCGLNVGLFGVNGFGVMRRRHERRCPGRRAAAVRPPFPSLLPRVDVDRDIRCMSSRELGEKLTVTGKELETLLKLDKEVGEEAMRPGCDAKAPLRPAMAIQPGDTADSVEVLSGRAYNTSNAP